MRQRAGQQLAVLLGAEPIYLRIPGVVPTAEVAHALLAQDTYVHHTHNLALLWIGAVDPSSPLQPGRNFFTARQLQEVKKAGAVVEICMRYIDADGGPVMPPARRAHLRRLARAAAQDRHH